MKQKLRREFAAGAVIFHEQGGKRQYLLLQYRTSGKYWGFPKGVVNRAAHESLKQAAVRELEEETGLKESALQFASGFEERVHYFFRDAGTLVSKDAVYFLARSRSTTVVLSDEHVGFKWLPYRQALARLTHRSHRAVLTQAEIFLQAHPPSLE